MSSGEEIQDENHDGESHQKNPFPGLRPFREGDKDFFFGRDGQVVELLARLRQNRFLAILGTSGSGKSSLVYAGLFPALHGGMMRGAGSHWRIAEFRPGSRPLKNLSAALTCTLPAPGETEKAPAQIRVGPGANDPFLEASVEATLRRSGLGLIETVRVFGLPKSSNLLVVVDQFEELFRFRREALKVSPHDEALALVRLLLEAVQQTELSIYVAITMRSEFLGECACLPELPEAINRGQYLVPRLSRDERRLAIEGPISVAGGAIHPRLVHKLLNDAGDNPDQLPILQHALMRTWNEWTRDHAEGEPLDSRHYDTIHGMEALSLHAEEILRELPTDHHRTLAEKMFKALTKVDAENRGTRNPASFGELCAITGAEPRELAAIIDAFRKPGRTFLLPTIEIELRPETIIDLSHESVMRVWGRLSEWTREEAQSARVYMELAKDARAGKSLYRDPELGAALKWQQENQPSQAWGQRYDKEFDLALDFLARSRRDREVRRRQKNGVGAAIVMLLAAVGAFYLVSHDRKLAAIAARLSAYAVEQLAVDPQESVALAWLALSTHQSTEAEDTLRESLFASNLRGISRAHARGAMHASFSPDGRYIVSIGEDGKVFAWEWPTAAKTNLIARHAKYATAMAFGPTGTFVASGDVDGNAIIADFALGSPLRTNKQHDGTIETANFHPREALLLTAGQDGNARIWNWPQGGNSGVILPHPKGVTSAEFSPSQDLILTACQDGFARIWDWRAVPPRALVSLKASNEGLKVAHFNSDGSLIVTAGLDGNVQIWNWQDGSRLGEFPHGESSKSAEFHPLSRLTLSVGRGQADDNSNDLAALFNWASRTNATSLLRHAGSSVESAAFSRDGELVVTTGLGTAHVWSTQTGAKLAVLRGHPTQVDNAAFHPNGTNLVTACRDGSVRVWELRHGQKQHFNLTNQMDAMISPNGGWAGFWRPEGAAWLCAIASTNVINVSTGAVDKLVFTPDSQGVIAVKRDAVSLWRFDAAGLALQWTTNLSGLRIDSRAALSKTGQAAVTSFRNVITFWSVLGVENVIASPAAPPVAGRALLSRAGIGLTTDSKGNVALLTFDGDNVLRRWRLGQGVNRSKGSADVLHVAFSPDDRELLHVSKELTSHIWDVKTKKVRPTPLSGYREQIDRAAFSPNGKFVVAGSYDHSVHLWST
ncbi:MAG: hypothetical protein L0Z50_20430, partial [Verrucomicrobiales bacterium]|nr:hypothetical protein [Verrucomicrobiales bacterium]